MFIFFSCGQYYLHGLFLFIAILSCFFFSEFLFIIPKKKVKFNVYALDLPAINPSSDTFLLQDSREFCFVNFVLQGRKKFV